MCGFQQLTASNLGSAIGLTPVKNAQTGQLPNAAIMTASATAVRYTDDGVTAPTASVGIRLPVGIAPFLYQGNLGAFKAMLESGTPTLDVTYLLVSD